MSSRKGLIFILLLLCSFSTLAPIFAVTTLSGGTVVSSFVLDTGTIINGAKPDVDKIELSITVGTNELNLAFLAPGSTTIAYGNDGALTFGGVPTTDASAYFLHMLARRVPAPLCLLTQTLIGLYALNQPFDSMSKMSINPTHTFDD